jgi:PAS domain-containing protein
VTERAGAATILVEMNNTRTEVLMSFFALRSANEKRRPLWASILDESCFACVLPVTPYRSFPASEVQVSKCQRTILGIDGMMSDTASLHVLLNTLVDRSRFPTSAIQFRYTLVTEEAVVAGNQMMARWVMQTLNATQCGARMEVSKQGMLCCKFNSAHKIVGLELMFDVMALMLQLKQAAGSDTFSVIPNTVQTCQRSFDSPMVMILADEPYTIVQVNKLWEDMSGYKADEVVGRTSCRVLEGGQTDANAVEVFMDELRFKRPTSAMILHYKKSHDRFKNFFTAYPLSTDSRITHYLIFTSHVGVVTDGSDVSSNNTQTTVSDSQQVLSSNPQLTIQPANVQSNYLTQNLRANFNAAQRQAAAATTPALPNFQPLIALPPVLPNHPVVPPNTILSTNIPPSSQPSTDYIPQQLQINAAKRPHESISTGDVGS